MELPSLSHRLAVCSWSLQPPDPAQLAAQLASLAIPRVQLALDPLRDSTDIWGITPQILTDSGIRIVSGMFGTIGEDYATLDSIKRTGGVIPDQHWEANWRNIQATAQLAARLGLRLVTFHAGFLPHSPSDPHYAKLMGRIRQVAARFADSGIELGFETGQETAVTLRDFLQSLDCPNVGVNFDPANMLLYDQGNPIQALRTLGPWLKQCHIKDARRTRRPGTWGEEVVVGTGEVDWPAFISTLAEIDYHGPLCIEREAGNRRLQDIADTRRFLERLSLPSSPPSPHPSPVQRERATEVTKPKSLSRQSRQSGRKTKPGSLSRQTGEGGREAG